MGKARMMVSSGNFQNCLEVHHALIDPFGHSLENGVGNVGPAIDFPLQESHINLGSGITNDELWIPQAHQISEQPLNDVNGVAHRLRADSKARSEERRVGKE